MRTASTPNRGGGVHVLTALDKLLLGLWLVPVALGLAAGLRAGGDEGRVMLFVTGIVAALYVAACARILHHARRGLGGRGAAALLEPAPSSPPQDDDAAPRGRSTELAVDLLLFLLVPAAVRLVVDESVWTVVVIAGLLVTVLGMAAHVHRWTEEPGPPVRIRP